MLILIDGNLTLL